MKKDEKKFVKYLEKKIDKYRPILGITIEKISFVKENDNYMAISFREPYMDFSFYYSDNAIKNFKNGKFEKYTILHELCHILTDPLYAKAIDRYVGKNEIEHERENLTEKMALILEKLIK